MSTPLEWKLFIKRRASATQGVPPSNDDLKWVANTTTLIYSEREALLVDTFLSDAQTAELADWIAASTYSSELRAGITIEKKGAIVEPW